MRVNLACSGAKTENIRSVPQSSGPGSVATQLDQLRVTADQYNIRLIVLSIGGNDLSFADIIKDCAKGYVLSSRLAPDTCNGDRNIEVTGRMSTAMTAVRLTIEEVQRVMSEKGKAPGTYRFVLQSYPSPLPRGRDFAIPEVSGLDPTLGLLINPLFVLATEYPPRVTPGRCPVWDADATWARDTLVPMLSDNLRAVSLRTGVEFLDLRDLFEGHEVCRTGTTRSPNPATAEWARFIAAFEPVLNPLAPPQGAQEESMHPNALGEQAIGRCLTLVYAQEAGGRYACHGTAGQGPDSVTLTTSTCQSPASSQVCLFTQSSYGGDSISVNPTNEIRNLSAIARSTGGSWDNQLSSMLLGAGTRVIAFEQAEFKGTCITFAAGDVGGTSGGQYQDLTSFEMNDKISSLMVVDGASGRSCADVTGMTPNDDQAFFFDKVNFGPQVLQFPYRAEIRDLSQWHVTGSGTWNDVISSAKLGRNVRVLAFEGVNYGGRCLTLAGSQVGGATGGQYDTLVGQLTGVGSSTWNDAISSLKVVDGRTGQTCANQAIEAPASSQVFLYENGGYGGESLGFTVGSEVSDLTKWLPSTGGNWNDRISAAKLGSNVRVLIFQNVRFGGACSILAGSAAGGMQQGLYPDLANFGSNWNDRISSLRVVNATTSCP